MRPHAPGFQQRTAPALVARITPVAQGQLKLAAQAAQGARAAFGLVQPASVLEGKPAVRIGELLQACLQSAPGPFAAFRFDFQFDRLQ